MVWFMVNFNDFFDSVKNAYEKSGGVNWPAKGKQLSNSYITLAAENQYNLINSLSKKVSPLEIANLFWSSTQIRYVLTGEFIIGIKIKNQIEGYPEIVQIAKTSELFLHLLELKSPNDPFCLKNSNRNNEIEEINFFLKNNPSNNSTVGKKITIAASALAWAYGYDTYFANFMEIKGPFKINNSSLIVREFNLKNIPLIWEDSFEFDKLIIYDLYSNKEILLDWELHLESKDELNLTHFLVVVEKNNEKIILSNEEVQKLFFEIVIKTQKQVSFVNELSVLEKIKKGAELVYLQTKDLSVFLGLDWKPTKEVFEKIELEGEKNWFDSLKPRPKSNSGFDNWIMRFDPRIPLD